MTSSRFEKKGKALRSQHRGTLPAASFACTGPTTAATRGRTRRSSPSPSPPNATRGTARATSSSSRPTAGCTRSKRGNPKDTSARPTRRPPPSSRPMAEHRGESSPSSPTIPPAKPSGGTRMCSVLPDGRIYTLIWTHVYGTSNDLVNHWTISRRPGPHVVGAEAHELARTGLHPHTPAGRSRRPRSTTSATSRRASTSP